jgi:hypothetical protein
MESILLNRRDIAIALVNLSLRMYIHAIGTNYSETIGAGRGSGERRRGRENADAWSNTNGAARRGGKKRRGRRPKRLNGRLNGSCGDSKPNGRLQRLSANANLRNKNASGGDRSGSSLSGSAWKRRQRWSAGVVKMLNENGCGKRRLNANDVVGRGKLLSNVSDKRRPSGNANSRHGRRTIYADGKRLLLLKWSDGGRRRNDGGERWSRQNLNVNVKNGLS